MKEFTGKVAVVTGAASGIGFALAEKCLAEGMHVVMADIEQAALEAAAEKLSAAGNNTILPVKTDVSIAAEIEKLKDKTIEEFGAVHLLFNNAGVGGGGNSWTATKQDWDWVLGVNLWSIIYGVQTFVPQMIAQDTECHVVNTASVAGLLGGSTNACYSVTKHGVVAFTENLFADLGTEGTKIGTSVLCPGFVNTNIFDSSRNRPDRLANEAPDATSSPEGQARMDLFKAILKKGLQPSDLADIVFDGIRKDQLYILTHEQFGPMIEQRAHNIANGINPAEVILPGSQ
ncbi:MAG: NAD(P)-dependent dehydrogenase (short-subunit alcohol dehydrogenase family) [Candidatus Azotimanducaceae bacterium]|jgi:NAD(P)-dependent dehydrogenase (short-subunit alcohol dehydrogenase family)